MNTEYVPDIHCQWTDIAVPVRNTYKTIKKLVLFDQEIGPIGWNVKGLILRKPSTPDALSVPVGYKVGLWTRNIVSKLQF